MVLFKLIMLDQDDNVIAGLVNLAFPILLSRPISPCGELLVQIRRGLRPLQVSDSGQVYYSAEVQARDHESHKAACHSGLRST
jgi:hypothetical protein